MPHLSLKRLAGATCLLLLATFALGAKPAAALAPVRAVSTDAFVDSLGVNTHMTDATYGSSYKNLWLTEWQISYLGIRYVRDCFCDDYSVTAIRHMNRFFGTKFDIVFSGKTYDTALALLKAQPALLAEAEGSNEADNLPVAFRGLTGLAAAAAQQKQLFADFKADTALKTMSLDTMSVINPNSIPAIGDMSAFADRLSIHIYPQQGDTFGEVNYPYVQYITRIMLPLAPNRPIVMTEGGFWTKPHPRGMTEIAHAKATLNFLFNMAKQGIKRSYLYQLSDEYADPEGRWLDRHFGLFNYDGPPKIAGTALHNLTSLLFDRGAPRTDMLAYNINNMPASGHDLLMQKSDGTFVLALWNGAAIWDSTKLVERPVPDRQIMLNFGQLMQYVTVFDPLKGMHPLLTKQGITGLTLMLPDHPVLVFAKPEDPRWQLRR